MVNISKYHRLIIKIGSAILINAKTGQLRQDWLDALSHDIAALHKSGTQIILVSSGAIALGRQRLSLTGNLSLAQKQASAAAGQSQLTQAYEHGLAAQNIIAAQALLTLTDTENRRHWLNARTALSTLLDLGAVPIINENDTVATDEIRYGDNDRLAARTAQMLGADGLVLLSDIDGLYTADPRKDVSAQHLPHINALTDDVMAMGSGANGDAAVGTGGMATKLAAAKIAMHAGCDMIICDGRDVGALHALQSGAKHTYFKAANNPKNARAQWIAGTLKPTGKLYLDNGACKALRGGSSLLAAGVTHISGAFSKGDAVSLLDINETEIARGLVAYGHKDAAKIIGINSTDIIKILGYDNGAALIHRDNLVML
ncbi:MAG: glutamate 5-kinase [Litorimonas sp.]